MYHLPPESATARAIGGPSFAWTTTEHLLASVVDVLAVANWQRSGRSRGRRPQPIERPGNRRTKRYGRAKYTIDEMRDRMARWSERHSGGRSETVS